MHHLCSAPMTARNRLGFFQSKSAWRVSPSATPAIRSGAALELLVIPDQHAGVNTFPGLVHTARHTTKVGNTRSQWPNPQGRELPKVGSVIGVKSKQGSRTGRSGWITSFLRSAEVPAFGWDTYFHSQLVHWRIVRLSSVWWRFSSPIARRPTDSESSLPL